MRFILKICLFLVMNLSWEIATGQSTQKFNSGTIYGGAFDPINQEVVENMTYIGKSIQLKRIDFDYYVYYEKEGSKLRLRLSKFNNDPEFDNKYIDELGLEYLYMKRGIIYISFAQSTCLIGLMSS